MSTGAPDPLIHHTERLRIVATLAALPDGDALSVTRLQDMIRLPPGGLITRLRELGRAGYVQTGTTGGDRAPTTVAAHGRLTLHELNARLDATLTATTHGELSRVTWDLPDLTVLSARVSLSGGSGQDQGTNPVQLQAKEQGRTIAAGTEAGHLEPRRARPGPVHMSVCALGTPAPQQDPRPIHRGARTHGYDRSFRPRPDGLHAWGP